MSAATLLDRLDGVKQTAPGRWISKCPAHADRRPSLYVRELDNGRTLIHCFGGCDPGAILDAVGLEFAALFPEGTHHQHARPSKASVPASDLLLMVDEDVLLASIAAAQFLETRTLTEADWQHLAGASRRLGWAVAEIRKSQPWRPAHVA